MGKKQGGNKKRRGGVAFFFFEGDTEDLFYKKIINEYVVRPRGIKRIYKNLKTGTGVNKQIANELYHFLKDSGNKDVDIYVYAFIDREGSRSKVPEFNSEAILKAVEEYVSTKQIRSMYSIEAIKMIESWFFYDLEGICNYVGFKMTKSMQQTYHNTERLDKRDLTKLFQKGSRRRYYKKGEEGFLNSLDLGKIYENCSDLKNGIDKINCDLGEN